MTAKARNPLVCHGHSRPIVELFFSPETPDGVFLISASKDGKPMLRNGTTGDWIGTFEGHQGAVWDVSLNQTALLAATGSADFTAKVWDACTGDELHSFDHKHIVRSVSFARDSRRVATGGMEKKIRVFDVNSPGSDPLEIPALPGSIRSLAWCQDDNLLLATLSDTPGIRAYDVRTQQLACTLETEKPVTSLDVCDGGRTLCTAEAGHVRLWDLATLRATDVLDVEGFGCEAASYHAGAGRIVAGGQDMWVHIFDCKSKQEVDVCKGHHGPVRTVRFDPTGASFASGSEDGTIRIWEV
ncbi:unnamed protein product [Pedinophyceae sp. YPF-701]|nr:unnamed protein product [Pedinophyceae sp. YPF-701]